MLTTNYGAARRRVKGGASDSEQADDSGTATVDDFERMYAESRSGGVSPLCGTPVGAKVPIEQQRTEKQFAALSTAAEAVREERRASEVTRVGSTRRQRAHTFDVPSRVRKQTGRGDSIDDDELLQAMPPRRRAATFDNARSKVVIARTRQKRREAVAGPQPIDFRESRGLVQSWLHTLWDNEPDIKHSLSRLEPSAADNAPIFDIAVLGEENVGKRTLISHFCSLVSTETQTGGSLQYSESESQLSDGATREASYLYNNKPANLRFAAVTEVAETENYMPDMILVVYSICGRESFESAERYLERLVSEEGRTCPIALVANKIDLKRLRDVSIIEGRMLAQFYSVTMLETSAIIGEHCDELLLGLLRHLLKKRKTSPRGISSINCFTTTPR